MINLKKIYADLLCILMLFANDSSLDATRNVDLDAALKRFALKLTELPNTSNCTDNAAKAALNAANSVEDNLLRDFAIKLGLATRSCPDLATTTAVVTIAITLALVDTYDASNAADFVDKTTGLIIKLNEITAQLHRTTIVPENLAPETTSDPRPSSSSPAPDTASNAKPEPLLFKMRVEEYPASDISSKVLANFNAIVTARKALGNFIWNTVYIAYIVKTDNAWITECTPAQLIAGTAHYVTLDIDANQATADKAAEAAYTAASATHATKAANTAACYTADKTREAYMDSYKEEAVNKKTLLAIKMALEKAIGFFSDPSEPNFGDVEQLTDALKKVEQALKDLDSSISNKTAIAMIIGVSTFSLVAAYKYIFGKSNKEDLIEDEDEVVNSQ